MRSWLCEILFYVTFILTTAKCLERTAGKLTLFVPVNYQIALRGYTVETYLLHTADGAILEMNRILQKKNVTSFRQKQDIPVLLIPGITMSNFAWIMLPEVSIVYGLMERGYDVFLCNLRGQSRMNKNKLLTEALGPKGWHFTQDDLARYDMPTFINHILKVTGKPKVHTIGYSLGNTVMFQLLASQPEYNDKVASLIAMAPSVYLEKSTGPMRIFNVLPFGPQILLFACAISGFGPMLFSGEPVRILTIPVLVSKLASILGRLIIFKQLGFDPDLSREAIPLITSMETPLPTLVNFQYLQTSRSGKFAYFDYGSFINQKVYGQAEAPVYDLTKVKSPVILMNGKTDAFDSEINTKYLVETLGPALYKNYYIEDKWFGHMSFLAANDIDRKVNEPIYAMLAQLVNRGKEQERTSVPLDGMRSMLNQMGGQMPSVQGGQSSNPINRNLMQFISV